MKLPFNTLMTKLLASIGLLTFTSATFAENFETIAPNNPTIEYTGRIDFGDPLAPKFSYSGVSIRACFSGTSIGAIMSDDIGQNYFNVLLDGKLIDTLNVGIEKTTYQLATGLQDTVHEIEIFKRTELTFGKTQFFGFTVDAGATLLPISNKRDKLIEFIGNSITCGYGNEGLLGGVFGPTTENHYMSYAAITARNFNARHIAVSRSGIGVYRNYDGPAEGSPDCMSNLYTRTFLYDENPKYTFTEQPDMVCINLGTNDFSTTGGDSAKYVSNYLRLIDTIQSYYSMPDIVCLLGPMLSGSSLNNIRNYLNTIAEIATAKGKGNVYVFEMSAQTGDLGIAIDYHPTVAQHRRNAAELTDYIKNLKGWKVQPQVTNASATGANHIKIEFNTPITDPQNNLSGFEIIGGDGQIIGQSTAYMDETSNLIAHILLNENISVGEKLSLNYTPGSIESTDSLKLKAFSEINIDNSLTETTIKKGVTTSDGTSLVLTFNKKLKETSSIDGLTVFTSNHAMAIDSFKISSTSIFLYLKEKIMKTDSVYASYTGNTIFGTDEIALSSFSKLEIKNSSKLTSIIENKNRSIEIYPNPNSSGLFYYSIGQSEASDNSSVYVYSINGELIYNQDLSKTKGVIDLNGKITHGAYIFKFTVGQMVVTKSVVSE